VIRSILVPLDGSDFAEHALPLAASLARRADATLHLIHAHAGVPVEASMGVMIPNVYDLHDRQDEQAYLNDVARRLGEKAPVKVATALLDGDLVHAIKAYAERERIDLVVMSTHARGAFARFWLGSVADDLAHELPQPILLLRPGEGKADLGHEATMKSIVVPLDGSEMAERAVWPAADLARLFDGEVTLVRVNRPALLPAYVPEGAGAYGLGAALDQAEQLERDEREQARRYLAEVSAMLAVRGVRCRADVILEDRPAEGIIAEAGARHADLIAMETHGRRGLARLFMGSVADQVVRGGEVPVLLYHDAGAKR
jgi:nucleotide-binding universal stress UspA family protein